MGEHEFAGELGEALPEVGESVETGLNSEEKVAKFSVGDVEELVVGRVIGLGLSGWRVCGGGWHGRLGRCRCGGLGLAFELLDGTGKRGEKGGEFEWIYVRKEVEGTAHSGPYDVEASESGERRVS